MAKKKSWDLKFVWPKDGAKGKEHRGFFGRLNNIVTGRGPDIFLDRTSSKTPIKPDLWGNWDSYHDFDAHRLEVSNPFIYARRGYKRYDPHSRRYKSWYIPEDWYGSRIDGDDKPHYPRFTEQEGRRILRCSMKSRGFTPLQMGKEWNFQGPKRFDGSHDWFWQDAHRLGENMRQGLPKYGPVNPFLLMHQGNPSDLDLWMHNEI